MENNVTYATTNPNSHYITNSSSFYYGNQMNHWSAVPISYSVDIAVEYLFSEVLEFPLDRIIYASNDYCFRERTRVNKGELNLPFMNYYRTGYDYSSRRWFNDFSNRFWLQDSQNERTTLMGGKMKIYPIEIQYEGTVFFAQNKDCEYAMNKLLYVNSNETIITPKLEFGDGNILENAGVFNLDVDYNPEYQENEWLEKNRIWTIGLEFSVRTFMIGQFDRNPDNLRIAKSVLLEFFSAKKINYESPMDSPQLEMLLSTYFGDG